MNNNFNNNSNYNHNLLLNNNNSDSNNENISIKFISTDQVVNCNITCSKNNTFAEIEEKLYQRYPQYRATNNNFLANGNIVSKLRTIAQNGIKDGFPVTLIASS